jgi:DtxR family Mn-dependent transcriptional regulator
MARLDPTTETVENYLKAIHRLASESPAGEAGMKAIATLVGVTTGTATSMVQRLGKARFVKYERFGGVKLTARGERTALDILRRHRLIETFLVNTLKLDWSIVHQEAERLEHALSPVVIEALDAFLGRPQTDPHGDPIPDARGAVTARLGKPLSDCAAREAVRVLRITDQDAAFLTFAAEHGLKPGALVRVVGSDGAAKAMRVQAEGHASISIGFVAAERVLTAAVE